MFGVPKGHADDERAEAYRDRGSCRAVAVIVAPDTEPVALRRRFAESGDIRNDPTNDATFEGIALFLQGHEVHSVAMKVGSQVLSLRHPPSRFGAASPISPPLP
jgi:hypothetical protein